MESEGVRIAHFCERNSKSSTIFFAPVFSIIRQRYVSMVLTVNPNDAAISLLVFPWDNRFTNFLRGVNLKDGSVSWRRSR